MAASFSTSLARGAIPHSRRSRRFTVERLDAYGEALGLAFQIMDDVLDVTGTTETLGKTAGRDTALRKSTYPVLLGLDGARAMAVQKVGEARRHLADADILTPELAAFTGFVVDRAS